MADGSYASSAAGQLMMLLTSQDVDKPLVSFPNIRGNVVRETETACQGLVPAVPLTSTRQGPHFTTHSIGRVVCSE